MPASSTLSAAGTVAPTGLRGITRQPWWPWVARAAVTVFLLVVVWLLVRQARTVDWPRVLDALRALPASALWVAGALAFTSHLAYGSFDLIGRRCTGHGLPRATTLGIAMASYAFTLNLGSLVGGVGVRYRLYERRGVDAGTIDYDAAQARRCVQAMVADCIPFGRLEAVEECQGIFTGTLEAGADCQATSECQPSTYCALTSSCSGGVRGSTCRGVSRRSAVRTGASDRRKRRALSCCRRTRRCRRARRPSSGPRPCAPRHCIRSVDATRRLAGRCRRSAPNFG